MLEVALIRIISIITDVEKSQDHCPRYSSAAMECKVRIPDW